MKKIVFTKTDSKLDKVEYFDSNAKSIAKLSNSKQGIIPHDLVHAIVESELGIRGFTQLIFDGNVPEFAMRADGEAWLSESMVEAIQGMLWSGKFDLRQFNDWVESICTQRQVEIRQINEKQFKALVMALEEKSHAWNILKCGQSLDFEW